jgi:hypothetical protein
MTTLAEEGQALTGHFVNPWCTEADLPAKRLAIVQDIDQAFMIGAATELLYILSGRQFRTGRSIIRPTSIGSGYANQSYLYPYSSMSGYGAGWGFAAGWAWTAIGMGWWQNGQDLSELVLQGPVRRINNVVINGQSLGAYPPSNPNYTLYDKRRLVLMVGSGSQQPAWPWEQAINLPLTEYGTFMVDYEWGKGPGPLGKLACIELATEMCLALSGDNDSKLPSRVLSIVTSGITMAVGDPLTYIREDLTGLPLCDWFLNAKNPNRLRRRSVFLAPNSTLNREVAGYPGS